MRIGSLFAGIGGFDLAARWMGWETAWYSEIEPYACRVMEKNFPGVPNLGDITKITNPPSVDMLVGGFPCQDISVAGKGVGIGGERSGLWSEFARLIGEIHPKWVVAENVSALRSRGLALVLQDFHALGYDAEWHCIPASAVGAPHQRDRIWIIAYPHTDRTGLEGRVGASVPERAGERSVGSVGSSVADPVCIRSAVGAADEGRRRGEIHHALGLGAGAERGRANLEPWFAGDGQWDVEPDVGRVADGVPSRVDRLRCLGNAIVPQVAYWLFQQIELAELRRAAERVA